MREGRSSPLRNANEDKPECRLVIAGHVAENVASPVMGGAAFRKQRVEAGDRERSSNYAEGSWAPLASAHSP